MCELQAQLLQQLAGPLMLPDALRCVGYLRRVGQAGRGAEHALSEPQLRAYAAFLGAGTLDTADSPRIGCLTRDRAPHRNRAFLRNRTAYSCQAEAALPRDNPVSYLLKYVELCRVHWHDVVTQYRTLFASDGGGAGDDGGSGGAKLSSLGGGGAAQFRPRPFAPHPTATRVVGRPAGVAAGAELTLRGDDGAMHVVAAPTGAATAAAAGAGAGAGAGGAAAGGAAATLTISAQLPAEGWGGRGGHSLEPRGLLGGEALGAALLADWAAERVGALLATLETWLPRVHDGAFLANLLEQSCGCAHSLGGVGLDFGVLLAAPFSAAILRTFDDQLHASLEHWRQALSLHRWSVPPPDARSFAATAAATAAAAAAAAAPPGGDGTAAGAAAADPRAVSLAPPAALLAQPILAVLCNHLLGSLNEVRQCMPYELRPDVLRRLTAALCGCARALQHVQASSAFGAVAADHFASLCALFGSALLPHIAAAADLLVPPHAHAHAHAHAQAGGAATATTAAVVAGSQSGGAGALQSDGGAERMVAAVQAELKPLLARDDEAPAAAAAAAAAPSAA